MERLDGARLCDSVVAPEQWVCLPTDRVAQVFGLKLIRIDVLELDPFGPVRASQLDHRYEAMPRIVDEERPLASDHLELVTIGQRSAAVELGKNIPRKAQRAGEGPIGAARADELLPVELLGLARE